MEIPVYVSVIDIHTMPPAKRARTAPDAPPDLLVVFTRARAPALFYHVKRAHADYRQEADLLDAHGADGGAPEALRAGFLLGVYGEVERGDWLASADAGVRAMARKLRGTLPHAAVARVQPEHVPARPFRIVCIRACEEET